MPLPKPVALELLFAVLVFVLLLVANEFEVLSSVLVLVALLVLLLVLSFVLVLLLVANEFDVLSSDLTGSFCTKRFDRN